MKRSYPEALARHPGAPLILYQETQMQKLTSCRQVLLKQPCSFLLEDGGRSFLQQNHLSLIDQMVFLEFAM